MTFDNDKVATNAVRDAIDALKKAVQLMPEGDAKESLQKWYMLEFVDSLTYL